MRKRRFREEQMLKILREAGKTPLAEVAKKHGMNEASGRSRICNRRLRSSPHRRTKIGGPPSHTALLEN
jgi:hypothetical protein